LAKASVGRINKIIEKKTPGARVDITIGQLLDGQFGAALTSLASKEPDGKTALLIARVMQERKDHLVPFGEARTMLLKRFADKDEAGEPMLNEAKTEFLFTEENRKEYDKAWDDLTKETVSILSIPVSVIEKMSAIKPLEVFALQSILE